MKLQEFMREKKYMIPLAVAGIIIVAGISYAAFGEIREREERSDRYESKYEDSSDFSKGEKNEKEANEKKGHKNKNKNGQGQGQGQGEGQGEGEGEGSGNRNSNETEEDHQPLSAEEHKAQDEKMINDLPTEELSQAEIEALSKMGEEEYLARDVYRALYEKWEIQSFKNIQKAESSHAQAITILQEKYELETFADHQEGVFEDSNMQELYDNLVKKGIISEIDALQVGMTIEDLDIYDLEKSLEEVDNQDITEVFGNLTRGSRNHMRSFNKQMVKRGGEYEAQYITPEKMQEIIAGEHESGDHDQGMGQNGGQGKEDGQGGRKRGGQGRGIRQ